MLRINPVNLIVILKQSKASEMTGSPKAIPANPDWL